MKIVKNDYQKLLVKVRQKIEETEKNIIQTVNRQKVEMCWEVGKIIDQHLLKNDRAEYGKHFFAQLAQDTKITERALYQMRSFFKAYPKLPKNETGLNWSHYRNLATIKNLAQRKQLEDLTFTQNLDGEELRREIKKNKSVTQEVKKLRVTRGRVFTYTKTGDGEIDLGFNIFFSRSASILSVAKNPVSKNKTKEIFEDKKWQEEGKAQYTYLAELERVVDGDTLHVKLDLGFGVKHHEILRLAKINAAEAKTKEGKTATAELKKILNNVKFLIVKTNKTDIYGRYVADVFFDQSENDPNKIAESGIYLNQMLLDRHLVDFYS